MQDDPKKMATKGPNGTTGYYHRLPPAVCDPQMMSHIEAAANLHAGAKKWQHMPSGAGHDAQVFAAAGIPIAMLFVPSIGGISHNFDEDTSDADIVLGCQVYTDASAAMLLQWEADADTRRSPPRLTTAQTHKL